LTLKELEDIHAELEQCLREVAGEESNQRSGTELAAFCRKLFPRPSEDPVAFDFQNGFIPLYERLENILRKNTSDAKTQSLIATVVFS
jgi:hypothetical protein